MRLTLIAAVVVFLACASVEAQTSVTLKATVSETIALSVAPTFTDGNVVSSGNTVRITVSGNDHQSPVIRVPLLVRSNSSFKISALFESESAVLEQLMVTDVHATGRMVSPHIVNSLEIKRGDDKNTSGPLFVLSGPRISLGGTLASPNNALQVTVHIRLKPQKATGWTADLTLVGTPGSLAQ